MAFTHSKDTRVLVNEHPASSQLRSVATASSRAMGEVTAFTDAGVRFLPGLKSGSLSLEGMYDPTSALRSELQARLTGATTLEVSAAMAGFAIGNPVAFGSGHMASYGVNAPVADPTSFSVELTPDEVVHVGRSLHPGTALTTTGNGTTVDDGADGMPTESGLAAILHVTGVSGAAASATVKVQHSEDDSVWVDLLTFTAATAVTSQMLTVAGTVNRYVRAIWTISGTTPSVSLAVAYARR